VNPCYAYIGHKRIWHSGSVSTYKSQLWLYPDLGYGIFASISGPQLNKTSAGLNRIMRYVSDILLDEQSSLNETLECSGGSNDEPSGTRTGRDTGGVSDPLARPATDYSGVYSNEAFGSVTIAFNETNRLLTLSMGSLLTANLLYNHSETTFYAAFTGLMWYHTSMIPVKFSCARRSGGTDISLLEIPLTLGPLNTAHSAHFSKGTPFKNKLDKSDPCACAGASWHFSLATGLTFALLSIRPF